VTAAPNVVGGELRPLNPATLEPVGSVPVTELDEMGESIAEARLAQRAWAQEPLGSRSRLLRRARAELLAMADEIASTVTAETGKPLIEATTTEVFVSLDTAAWLARNLGRVLGPERMVMTQPYLVHKRARVLYQPVGVVGILSPWNFPFSIPFTQVAAALAAGNAVLLKPSELTPLSGALVEEVFRRAGTPRGLVHTVQGPGATVGDAVVRHPGVRKVVFTGSTSVGRMVAARCAERLCPVTLELGGKDAMLVLDDADLERAIDGALWGSFANCGQVCSAVERIFVADAVYEPFLRGLADRAASLRIGRGEDPQVELGPLISEGAREKVEHLVADAVAHGAHLVTGGKRPETGLPGWFLAPTVLAGDLREALLEEEEIFGPAVTVVRTDNEAHAVSLVNRSRFALGASVWTRDSRRARQVAAQIDAGSVWMNDCSYSYGAGQAPWGGWKDSGHGRTHSRHGLYGLSNLKFTDEDDGRLRPPWWYPYDGSALAGFRGALEVVFGRGLRPRATAAWRHRSDLVELGRRVIGTRR
jgi:succinate-semialdehyde dehydrogenase/glutarate-semialdehyde dehydrogenase